MNFKTFFKDKKNLAITILSVLLIASFSSQGNQSQELSQAEDKIEQLSQDVKQAKSDLKDSQDELADFKEENADYIEVGRKEVQKTKEIENSAETAVKNLEKDQTQANLDLATSKVDAVTDADKKEKFQKRIATVKTAIEAKKELEDKAETAVKNLENNQSRDNIDEAKNKVSAVNNSTKKEAFKNRINAVISAIEAKEAEAAKQAQEQAAAEAAAQQAQQQQNQAAAQPGDTTTVYITRTGSHYHLNPNCRGLNRSKSTTPVSLSEAQALGLTLCGFE